MADKATPPAAGGIGGRLSAHLVEELQNLVAAATQRLIAGLGDRIATTTERLTEYAATGGPGLVGAAAGVRQLAAGNSPLTAMVSAGMAGGEEKLKQMASGKGGKGGKGKLKVTNIVEAIDVGVPVRVAYNQWTQFEDFPSFMKRVENIEQSSDERLSWKAQIFWSHRTWESTVVEQVPDKRIIWRSAGEKGSVDGAVTFHELAPELTRILLVLEYNPQGLFERTGNIWRAQGRRVRLELKHFARHAMTQTILRPDEVEGWRGEIRDGRVVKDHESALAEEKHQVQQPEERREHGEEEGEEPAYEAERRAAPGPRRPGSAPGERPRPPVRRGQEPAVRAGVRRTRSKREE